MLKYLLKNDYGRIYYDLGNITTAANIDVLIHLSKITTHVNFTFMPNFLQMNLFNIGRHYSTGCEN